MVVSQSGTEFARWIKSVSLWVYSTGEGCCANEFLSTVGCRYDLERFGCRTVSQPLQADLLVINGAVTAKALPELKKIYDEMQLPKYTMAIGSCACRGGAFAGPENYSVVADTSKTIPIDVFVPGCPPRPEAIMNGLILLQEKIRGFTVAHA